MLRIEATCTAELARLVWRNIRLQIAHRAYSPYRPCTTTPSSCTCHAVGHRSAWHHRQVITV